MNATLLAMATANPPRAIPQERAMQMAVDRCCDSPAQTRLLQNLYRRSGVAQRGSVVIDADETDQPDRFYPQVNGTDDQGPDTATRMARYAAESLPLAHRAASLALEEAGLEPQAITHLITCSCTGFSAPGLEIRLLESLKLRPTINRTHIGFMGCHGAFNALAVARSIAMANPAARVLVCSVELCSLHFTYGFDTQKMVANALFSDGAAAAIVSGEPDSAAGDRWRLVETGSCIIPHSADAMTWQIGNHGFAMTLSGRVPDIIAGSLRDWLEPWLASHDVSLSQVGSWAIHPGGPRIVEAAEQALGLPVGVAAESRRVLKAHGNMSSATILFILQRLRAAHAKRPCVALGFGPGLAAEVMLFR